MNTKFISIAYASLLSLAILPLSTANAHEQNQQYKKKPGPVCSLNTLKGTYLFSGTGKDANVDFSFAGSEQFDGKGNIVTKQSVNGNSQIVRITGNYTLNSDCTGSSSYSDTTHYNLFVSPDGSVFHYIQTDLGSVLSGQELRVAP